MTKIKFLLALHERLSDLPQNEVEERLSFYSEMIEDRIEEGLSEGEAVAAVGTVDEIAAQITAEAAPPKTEGKTVRRKKQRKTGEIVLLILGAPVWLSLMIAAVAVLVSLYVSLWAVIASLWSVFASGTVGVIGGLTAGIAWIAGGSKLAGLAVIGAGIACAGITVFLFFGCRAATRGVVRLTSCIGRGIKRCFGKKEEAQ